jgi:hypothetical protein
MHLVEGLEGKVSIKETFAVARRLIVLTCTMLFCFAVATFGSGLAPLSMLTESFSPSPGPTPATSTVSPWQAFVPLLIFSLVISAIFGYIIIRSRWSGLKLTIAVFVAFYGLMTIVSQLESLVFLRNQLPQGLLSALFAQGFIMAALFSPLAVLIMGKMKKIATPQEPRDRLAMPFTAWAWKLLAIGVTYVILYTLFGYFVAWKNPAIQLYYGGHDPGSLSAHLANMWNGTPWIFFFQFVRGLMWLLFALPVIQMHKGGKLEVSVTLAVLFAFWSFQLLIPNPYMPAEVTRVHLIEIFSSNCVFGFLVGLIFINK